MKNKVSEKFFYTEKGKEMSKFFYDMASEDFAGTLLLVISLMQALIYPLPEDARKSALNLCEKAFRDMPKLVNVKCQVCKREFPVVESKKDLVFICLNCQQH